MLGIGCGWLVERTDLPGCRGCGTACWSRRWPIPAFVNGFGWISLTRAVEGFRGALLIVTLSYYPLVYLPVVATLRGLDPALEETAYSLGPRRAGGPSSGWCCRSCGRRCSAAALLVSLHLLAEFGALQMLRFPTFTTAIYDQYRSTFNGAAANMIAGVLVLFCVLLLTAELRLRGHRRYARVSHGAARPAERQRLGAALRWPVALVVAGVVALAVGVPTYSLAALAGRRHLRRSSPRGELLAAAGTSLGLGAAAALVTVLLAIPVAWLAVRYRNAASTLVERSTYIANALPGIVVALALVTVSIRVVQPALPDLRAAARRPTRSCSCPAPWSASGPRSSRRRSCSTTSPTASAPARCRPPAG